jgi:hypothetical protein
MFVVSRTLEVSVLETRGAGERFHSMLPLMCIHIKERMPWLIGSDFRNPERFNVQRQRERPVFDIVGVR